MTDAPPQLQQLPAEARPVDGVPVAALAVDPRSLAERFALTWRDDVDELGPHRFVVVRAGPDAPAFTLTAYEDDALGALLVTTQQCDDLGERLTQLLAALEVRPGQLIGGLGQSRARQAQTDGPRGTGGAGGPADDGAQPGSPSPGDAAGTEQLLAEIERQVAEQHREIDLVDKGLAEERADDG